MLYLWQPRENGAIAAKNFCKAANPVEVGMPQENPFWFVRSQGQMPESDADVLSNFFRGHKPRLNGVGHF